jgi:orotate phosphoribosyltransferase
MKNIAEILLDLEAVKISINPPFTWTSGIKSPVYCDNRVLISYPRERKIITQGFKQLIANNNLDIDCLAGTATAGIPWAAFLAEELDLPMVFVRGAAKKHGTKKQIEGRLAPGSKVLIVEDLISTGTSSLVTAEAIRSEGQSEVVGVAAIMTWELVKSKKAFAENAVELFTMTGFSELVPLAVEKGQIEPTASEIILDFKNDPPAWGEKL